MLYENKVGREIPVAGITVLGNTAKMGHTGKYLEYKFSELFYLLILCNFVCYCIKNFKTLYMHARYYILIILWLDLKYWFLFNIISPSKKAQTSILHVYCLR